MTATTATYLLGYGGLVLLVLGTVVALTVMIVDATSPVRVLWARYEATLDREVRFLLLKQTGAQIARMQAIGLGLVPLVAFLLDEWIFLLLAVPILGGPYVVLKRRSDEKLRRLEEQLDPWLLLLSNALKASPSLGEAVGSSAKLMRPPWSDELDLALKEMRLGTPLDQAVLNMSARIDSPSVSSALATILVGRQTGGDLPKILEESAATLREMARLEGVVRTKTAEGKTQAIVLGAVPFGLVAAIHFVDEHWLEPLGSSTLGFII
ncbi:MAG: type II secretion system F family protein, partial [Sandaracinaceae bacterium]|nr:type II secretion system F family protein [Sandaracinaceae bacterium]